MADYISAAAGVVALVAAALMWTVGDKHTPRLIAVLVVAGVAGIVGTPIGQWMRDQVNTADGKVSDVIGTATGATVAGLIGLVALYVLVIHLKRRAVTLWTLGMAAVVPLVAGTMPGMVGTGTSTVVGALGKTVNSVVGAAFGIGG